MKWYYLLLTSQEQLLKSLVCVVYVDDMWTITVNCQWFVWPILFAAVIQNFEIGGIASHSLLKKYLKYLNTMCST